MPTISTLLHVRYRTAVNPIQCDKRHHLHRLSLWFSRMPPYKNNLLAALFRENCHVLFSELSEVQLNQRDILYEVDDPIEYVYFIEDGVASVLTTMADGGSIEVGMIGFEGLVGVCALLGEERSNQQVVIQLSGKAFRMKTAPLKSAFDENAILRKLALRFVNAFLNLGAQTAACNRLHMVEQRCARWLLMSSDRTRSDILPLTQEYLAAMIGVRRAGVTEAAGELQRAGLIRYTQGQITIVDRPNLEKTACECYPLDRQRFDRLLSQENRDVR